MAQIVGKRRRVNLTASLVISMLFAAMMVGICTADLFVVRQLSPDKPLDITVRIPTMGTYQDTLTGGAIYRLQQVRQGRGTIPAPEQFRMIQAYEDLRRPPGTGLLLGLGTAFTLIFFLFASFLRGRGGAARLLRTQVALFFLLVLLAAISKFILLATHWSAMWIPLVAITIPVASRLGRAEAAAMSFVSAITLAMLTPVDLPLLAVLLAQGAAAAVVTKRPGWRWGVAASATAATAGMIAYSAIVLLLEQHVPLGGLFAKGLSLPSILHSDIAGSVGGAAVGGLLAIFTSPLVSRLLGQLSRAKLIALANLEHPLLKRVAHDAPGTWAHSMNIANMAEMAANSIGADGLLTRVGAYYHDLGKSEEPKYFIENQRGTNPHDELSPEISTDAILAHVTDGVNLARTHKLPQPVIEFIYMHHGDSLLQYFWHKAVQQGAPKEAKKDYHYPGIIPQNRETAILCIADSVEAASRTLKEPGSDDIARLVRLIVFEKLSQGLLDESGLSVAELRQLIRSLSDTLHSSMHVRVRYPWQDAEEAKEKALTSTSRHTTANSGDTDTATEVEAEGAEAAPKASQTPPEKPAKDATEGSADDNESSGSLDDVIGSAKHTSKKRAVRVSVPQTAIEDPAWVSGLDGESEKQHSDSKDRD
jgi:cyclic-di-AMP phosphodiesterase PgpH